MQEGDPGNENYEDWLDEFAKTATDGALERAMESKNKDEYIRKELDSLKYRLDNFKAICAKKVNEPLKVFPWVVLGMGGLASDKGRAKSLNTCPLKCPTFAQI